MHHAMLKKLFLSIIIAAVAIATAGCGGDEPSKSSTRRTVLVYMVAANSLGAAGHDYADIAEMQEGVKKGMNDCRLLVYHNSMDEAPVLKEITPSGIKVLAEYSDGEYSTSMSRMNEVIADAKRMAPANDYGLILWSHASAWVEPTIDAEGKTKSFGSDRNREMSIPNLAKTLKGKGFSFIYFDCCYMANVESVYELRNTADYIAGSTIELPADGMPYDQNIPLFFEDTPNLKKACENTFNYYNSLDTQIRRTCTMSLIATSKLPALAEVCRRIYALRTPLSEDFDPQRFQTGDKPCLFDLAQYMHVLDAGGNNSMALVNALYDTVLYEAHTKSIWAAIDIFENCGLSCYIINPADGVAYRGYNDLQWWTDVASAAY